MTPNPMRAALTPTAAVPAVPAGRRAAPPGRVSRPDLVARLRDAEASLAVLVAPAGYGKTTLLREWQDEDPRPFAWVTSGGHDDARSLALAVEDALDEVAPPPVRSRGARTRSRQGSSAVALARVVRSLATREPFVLVIDDADALHGTGARDVLSTLLRHLPATCRLVLASRSEPRVPIGRLRADGGLTEIRVPDLAMGLPEAADLLVRSGLRLARRDVETLTIKTEGWPAALYLAAVALGDGSRDLISGLAEFGGDDDAVAGYLHDEVLAALPAGAVAFLRATSVLDELSAPVCDAVLGGHDAGETLTALGAVHHVLVPLDHRGEAYRCPRPLAELLRADLRRLEPDLERRGHTRASDYHAARGEFRRAISHAMRAGDLMRAAGLLRSSAPAYVTPAMDEGTQDWLRELTDEQLTLHPGLALAAANGHFLRGQLDPVQRLASAGRRVLHETPPAERSAADRSAVALLHAAGERESVVRMGRSASAAYGLEAEDSAWRPLCCLLDGVAAHLAGDRVAAERKLEEGVRRGSISAPNIQTLCLAQLAVMAGERGDWAAGGAFVRRATAQMQHYGLAEFPSSALVFAASAAVGAHRGRIEEAQADARTARRLLAELTDFMPWYEAEARVALAWAALRLSDVAQARELLTEAARSARRVPDAPALAAWVEAGNDQVTKAAAASLSDAERLTPAELRVLAFLPTHLSFPEIASEVQLSTNTIKTQAHAVYRKLDAASRSEAVARATACGLLDA